MTLLDLIPHRRHAPALLPAATVAVVEIPELVYTPMLYARRQTLHRPEPATVGRAGCGLQTWPMSLVLVEKVRQLDPEWCLTCWPGRRCDICQRPSGVEVECPDCLDEGIAVDKAIERRAA